MGLIYKSVADANHEEEKFVPYEINGYLVQAPLAAAGGGNCKWGIVTKYGRKFFLKEFLSPKFPNLSADISPAVREMQLKECNEWLNKHTMVYNAIKDCNQGNMVVPLDFFRFRNNFYLVTEYIESYDIKFEDICKTSFEQKMILLKVLAHQFAPLAKKYVIHSDLKPDNLMLKKTLSDYLTVKIIDFDASFLENDPPDAEDMVGDSVYFSPEAIYYQITEGEGKITPKADIFSLGIIFHQILCGELPKIESEEYDTIGEAVLNGERIILNEGLLPEFVSLIHQMLERDASERISAEDIWKKLKEIDGVPDSEQSLLPGDILIRRTAQAQSDSEEWKASPSL